MVLDPLTYIGTRKNGTQVFNGGIIDFQINTDVNDPDWYKDTSWDDAE
jgi:hypothetical protein